MKSPTESGGLNAVRKAWEILAAGGDPVDAVVSGVNLVENDPDDVTVGSGDLFFMGSTIEILLEAHDKRGKVVGEAKTGGPITSMTTTFTCRDRRANWGGAMGWSKWDSGGNSWNIRVTIRGGNSRRWTRFWRRSP